MRWVWILFLAITPVWAEPPVRIALELMTPAHQALARPVMMHYTLHRQYTPRRFTGQIADFEFMLDNLEVCSMLAEQAGMLDYRPVLMPDGRLMADNHSDVAGWILPVFCGENQRIYYVEGAQRGVVTARGRGVVVVNFRQVTPAEIEYSGQLFVRADNPVAAALAHVFYIFLRHAVDQNFELVMQQPILFTHLAAKHTPVLRQLIQQLAVEDYRKLITLDQRLATRSD